MARVTVQNSQTCHCQAMPRAPSPTILAAEPTLCIGLPARGGPGLGSLGCTVQPRQTDAVDQFVARAADGYKARAESFLRQKVLCQ